MISQFLQGLIKKPNRQIEAEANPDNLDEYGNPLGNSVLDNVPSGDVNAPRHDLSAFHDPSALDSDSEDNPVLRRLLQQVQEDQNEPTQRPLLDRLMAHINSVPTDDQPHSRGQKIIAALAGFGAGIRDPRMGPVVANSVLDDGYRKKVERYKLEEGGLEKGAQYEEQGLNHADQARNRRQMMLDRIIDDQRAAEAARTHQHEFDVQESDKTDERDFKAKTEARRATGQNTRLGQNAEKIRLEKIRIRDARRNAGNRMILLKSGSKEENGLKAEAQKNVMGLSGFSDLFNPDGSFKPTATTVAQMGAKAQMRKEFLRLKNERGYRYPEEMPKEQDSDLNLDMTDDDNEEQ